MADATDARLADIAARAAAATPGPWFVCPHESLNANPAQLIAKCIGTDVWSESFTERLLGADAVFAAHARSDIPWLLALVGELRQGNDVLREMVQAACDGQTLLRSENTELLAENERLRKQCKPSS